MIQVIARWFYREGTCRLDRQKYPAGRDVSDQVMQRVNLERDKFHGEWHYVIKPSVKAR